MLLQAVGPVFAARLGVPPHRLEGLSVLQIGDHLDYLREAASDG